MARRAAARPRERALAPAVHRHGRVSADGQYDGFEDWAAAFNRRLRRTARLAGRSRRRCARRRSSPGSRASPTSSPTSRPPTALQDAGLGGIAYWEVMDWENAAWQRARPRPGASPNSTGSRRHRVPGCRRTRRTRSTSLRCWTCPTSCGSAACGCTSTSARRRSRGSDRSTAGSTGPTTHGNDWHLVERAVASGRCGRSASAPARPTFVDRLGVLGPDCHIAHGVYMTAADRALLRARGTAVALCPRSNEVIGLDPPPVADYLREGSPIAIGTDSLSSSPVARPDGRRHRAAPRSPARRATGDRDLHERLLSAATLGGAHAMGLDVGPDRIGHLAVGARADLALFDVDGRHGARRARRARRGRRRVARSRPSSAGRALRRAS